MVDRFYGGNDFPDVNKGVIMPELVDLIDGLYESSLLWGGAVIAISLIYAAVVWVRRVVES